MKNCSKCGKTLEKDFEFCPYCGKTLDDNNSWGILGKNDNSMKENPFANSFFGGGILNKMVGNMMKMLEKEMKNMPKSEEMPKFKPKTNLQLFINGKKVNIGQLPTQAKQIKKNKIKKEVRGIPSVYFTKDKLKKFSNLEKQDPQTSVRRLSDRIIYDIEMPDVKSKQEISIVSLENSIEIKALGKTKAYYKVIRIGLPIIDYYIDQGKLILELGIKK